MNKIREMQLNCALGREQNLKIRSGTLHWPVKFFRLFLTLVLAAPSPHTSPK